MKGGDTYYCTVHQGKLIPEAKDIVFSFKVDEGTAEMEITEVRISTEDPETAIVRGKVTLSEPVYDDIVVPKLFKTPTTWKTETTIERLDDWTFEFEMSGLRRSSAGSAAVKLIFDAPAIGFGKKLEASIVVPGKGEFKVIQANLVDAAEPYISIQFSEPLNEEQSLEGLVYLDEILIAYNLRCCFVQDRLDVNPGLLPFLEHIEQVVCLVDIDLHSQNYAVILRHSPSFRRFLHSRAFSRNH
jgi:hypothetical protein